MKRVWEIRVHLSHLSAARALKLARSESLWVNDYYTTLARLSEMAVSRPGNEGRLLGATLSIAETVVVTITERVLRSMQDKTISYNEEILAIHDVIVGVFMASMTRHLVGNDGYSLEDYELLMQPWLETMETYPDGRHRSVSAMNSYNTAQPKVK